MTGATFHCGQRLEGELTWYQLIKSYNHRRTESTSEHPSDTKEEELDEK